MDRHEHARFLGQQAGEKLREAGRQLRATAQAGIEGIARVMGEPAPCKSCGTPTPRWLLLTASWRLPTEVPKGFVRPHWCCSACVEAAELELAELRRDQVRQREYQRVFDHGQRAREKGYPATLTGPEWLATLDRFDWRCYICGEPFTDLEHLTPIARGGGTTTENCVPACSDCNTKKGSRHPDEIIRLAEAIQRARIVLATPVGSAAAEVGSNTPPESAAGAEVHVTMALISPDGQQVSGAAQEETPVVEASSPSQPFTPSVFDHPGV